MRKLFFDLQISGHHSEYINHLVTYITDNKVDDEFYFVVHTRFAESFPNICEKTLGFDNIKWLFVSDEELQQFEKKGILRRSIATYRLVNKYAKQHKADHVTLLFFNTFQIALGIFRSPFTISGILFKQFSRMSKKGNFVKYYRKYFQTWVFTLNSKVKKVFVLNDEETAQSLNHQFNTTIFDVLPDPIPLLQPLANFDIYEEYAISKDKLIFLHFGSLSDRKGTLAILDAWKLLPPEVKNKIALTFVGKAVADIVPRLNEAKDNAELKGAFIWDNKFVSEEKMKSLFDQSYCVLMPYKNAEASSGILGHAAAAGKMVIATGKGLLKEMVTNYQLGLLIDEVTPDEIAKKMEEAIGYEFNGGLSKRFLDERTVTTFAKKILAKV